MELSYSSSSDDSMYSAFDNSDMYSSGAIDIPRSQSSFDTFGDFSPPSSYPLQNVPDVYALNAPYTIPVQSSSPFDPAPLQRPPLNWEDIPLPEYLGTSGSSPEQPKPQARQFGCISCGKAFTRAADLKRHESSVHFPVKQDCPVGDCLRKDDNGFPRRDHLIEHLRSYHHWDVPKRRVCKRAGKASA
ncbi:C2H2 finger domain protein [Aspergillus sp. HF37]|nr:C2H2 finger domain protein [Aspergillus sp. HF37]